MRIILSVILLFVATECAASTDSTGTVRGRVFMGAEREPGGYANVIVVGTRRGAQADSTGAFQRSNLVASRNPVGTRPRFTTSPLIRILSRGRGGRATEAWSTAAW